MKIVVACLGDSITAGSPAWDPDPAVRATIPDPDPQSQFEYWVAEEDPRLELRNCGVYGERTDEIARRLEAAADGAHTLIVQGGINDIAQERSVPQAAENLRAMVARGKALGLQVALANVLPWNNGYPRAEKDIRRLNGLIDEIEAEEDVPILRFYDALEDSARPGRMPEEWTSDGGHPSVEGYRRLGAVVLRRGLWGPPPN
jgi:lysophospholipase L1-like esterase